MAARTELEGLTRSILDDFAPPEQRLAVSLYGPSVYARPGTYIGYDVLVVCEEYANGLRAHRRNVDGKEFRLLLAEKNLVESDARKGTLGDFLTEKLLYPYHTIANDTYLENIELEAKSRVVKEETKDLVLEYGEMCRGLLAKTEFFGLARMRKRARVFLPSMDDYLRFLEPSVRQHNIALLHDSYKKAIMMFRVDLVELDGDDVIIPDSTIDKWITKRTSEQVVNILKQSQRAFYSYLTQGRAIYLNSDFLARELYSPLSKGLGEQFANMEPEDPKNYLYLRTAEELVSLNERASLEDIVTKLRPGRPITIMPLAGVLNEVFLVTVGNEQFVAKRFTDWHGFKWFTLNLVAFGSKLFSVSGKARMSNEYGINRYLAKKGLKVPRVIHASLKERILLESYVPGSSMANFVTQNVGQRGLTKSQYQIADTLGETLAKIHQVGVSIGDSKLENFVVSDNEIYVLDLEQAGKRGDYAWDIAELLFYTGHYSLSPTPTRGLMEMVHAFIHGYLRRGDAAELNRAAGVRYTKVFSFWTPATVILEISKMLREAK